MRPRAAQRFVDALRSQLECAEVHADALGDPEIEVRLHRLRWIHVNGLHEPARLVRADRQKRQIDRTEPASDVAEEGGIRGVAGEEDAGAARDQHEPTPQGAIAIEWPPRGEVLRRRQRDRQHGVVAACHQSSSSTCRIPEDRTSAPFPNGVTTIGSKRSASIPSVRRSQ